MKKLLLLSILSVVVAHAWSQQRKDPNQVMHMQQYWDSVKKKNEAQLKAPFDLLKKKQVVTMKEQNGPKLMMPDFIHKNTMPVLSPDSNYVYNMPGTHAFDKTKAKGGVIFVVGKTEKNTLPTGEKK